MDIGYNIFGGLGGGGDFGGGDGDSDDVFAENGNPNRWLDR